MKKKSRAFQEEILLVTIRSKINTLSYHQNFIDGPIIPLIKKTLKFVIKKSQYDKSKSTNFMLIALLA